jgi:hypothetical protein
MLLGVISTLWAKTLAVVKAGFADWYCLIFESVTKNSLIKAHSDKATWIKKHEDHEEHPVLNSKKDL